MCARDREPPAPNDTSKASEKVDNGDSSPEVGDGRDPGDDKAKESEGELSNCTLIATQPLTL